MTSGCYAREFPDRIRGQFVIPLSDKFRRE